VPSRPEYSTTAIAAFGVEGLLTQVWVLLSLAATLVSSRAAIVAELAFIATSKEFVHPLGGVVVAVVPFPRATQPRRKFPFVVPAIVTLQLALLLTVPVPAT